MAKSKETQTEKVEREYIIPLREKGRVVPRYKKTPKAVKTVKEFLVRHMKIRDRDLKKIKIDRFLNEVLWFRGIKNPPHKIKVKAIKEGEIVRTELAELPEKLRFKKEKEEKIEIKAREIIEKKKSLMQKAREGLQKPAEEKASGTKPQDSSAPTQSPERKQTEEEKKEEKEKAKAGAEFGKEIEKSAAKKAKHGAGAKTQQKHQFRKALAK